MAVEQQRQLYAPQIEALTEQYGTAMGDIAKRPLTGAQIDLMAPQVAGQTALQQQATTLAGQGVGAYAPYVTAAGAAGTAAGTALGQAGTQLTTAQTGLGGIGTAYADPAVAGLGQAQTTLGGVSPYIGAAGTGLGGAGTAMAGVSPYIGQAAGLTGAGAGPATQAGSIAEYMSPYQQQVIDTTIDEFNRQRAIQQQAISDRAVALGGYGGGRHGVEEAEFMTGTARNRAALQAQMQQQGFTQAQQARQADMAARLGIGGAQQQYATGLAGLAGQQLGLGQATGALAAQQGALAQGYLAPGQMMMGVAGQQAGTAGQRAGLGQAQLGLGQFQAGLGAQLQGMAGQDISTVGRVGAADQAYAQAVKDAERERQRMGIYEPYERMGYIGSGLSGLMQGMGPQYQFTTQPNQSPLATALGIGSALGGIYGDYTHGTGSDVRLKTDIELTGKSPAGVNVYSFKYKGNDKTYQGVMAQEVPWASIEGKDGYLKVDYSKVDVEFKRLN